MSLATIQKQNSKIGTCPHGLPIGACPICNGMGSGASRRDVPRNPGEMTYNQCVAMGAMLRAQKHAKEAREQQQLQYLQNLANFQKKLDNISQKIHALNMMIANSTPAIISKPINFILNNIVATTINFIKNLPTNISNLIQTINQKFADISDKLTAMMGELKASIEKTISENFKVIKKKIKSIFSIFSPTNIKNDDKKIDETKRTFELKTFIHDLYKRFTENNKKDLEK